MGLRDVRVSVRAILHGQGSQGNRQSGLSCGKKSKPCVRHVCYGMRPGPQVVRAAIETWWWCRRAGHDVRHPPPWRRGQWSWQRMRRGWSDRDTWNLDSYLAHVISGSVTHLRDHGRGYSGEQNGANEQQWHDILTQIAEPLSRDWDRVNEDEAPEQNRERKERELGDQQDALRLMAQWFHHLWD